MNPLNFNQIIVNHKQSSKGAIRNIDHSGPRGVAGDLSKPYSEKVLTFSELGLSFRYD